MAGGSGIRGQDLSNAGLGQNISRTGLGNASALYGTLSPTLTTMAINPQGINPADMAKIQTSNQQTAGGANAGAVGQGSLLAARTRNAGTGAAALAKSSENASQNLSKANLAAQNENVRLKQQQQQEGLAGLNSLYGTNARLATGGLEASNQALKNAGDVPNFWQQLLMQGIKSGGNVASSYYGG